MNFIILAFLLANWMDTWFHVGDTIMGIKGWLYLNWEGDLLFLMPLIIGAGLILWDTKFVQEGF